MRRLPGLLLLVLVSLSATAQTFGTFEVFPSVAVKGVTSRIRLHADDGFDCRNDPVWCGISKVTIGGVNAPAISFTELFAEIEVILPDLPAGTVADVVVTDIHGNIRRRAAVLQIVDPSAPFSSASFDRVLIPVIYEGAGEKGSRWTTDVWMMGTGTYDIPFLRGPVPQLVPEQPVKLEAVAPNGYVLYPGKNATDDLSINVLVRDLSRQGEALGTELRAIRESELENRRIVLMNVPADPHFRLTLRGYALDRLPFDDRLNYWLSDLETGQQVAFGILRLNEPSDERTPWSGTVADLMTIHPEIANKGPLRLSISPLRPDPNARFWAFISVTNNETQHVTAITPNQ